MNNGSYRTVKQSKVHFDVAVDGTSTGAVQFLSIGFKNLAYRTSTVYLTVHNCKDTFLYSDTPPEIEFIVKKSEYQVDTVQLRIDAGSAKFLESHF